MKKSKNPLNLGLSRKGKKFIASNPRLLTISDNERQLLLNERVANILENAHKFEEHYYGFECEEKVDFSDIPTRLQKFRDLDCALWRKAASPFEPEEESKFLQDLNQSNQLKNCVTRLPIVRPSSASTKSAQTATACSSSQISSSQHEDSQELFEISDPEDSNPRAENDNVETLSLSQSEKKLFPVFSLPQKQKKKSEGASSATNCSQTNSTMNTSSDFLTPKQIRNSVIKPKKLSSQMPVKEEPVPKPTGLKSSDIGSWRPPPLSMSDHKDLAQDLLSLFLEKIDSDITIYGREEKPIKAHKLILRARCPRLLKDIVIDNSSKQKKQVIPLTCFSHTAVKSLLSYLYCGRILPPGFRVSDLRERDLDEIIELGKKYGLDLSSSSQPTSSSSPKDVQIVKELKEIQTQTESTVMEEKSIQTETTDEQKFAEEEERLNSRREDERSREYHCDSRLYEGSYRQVFQKSPDLFEDESFNDRVFAHSFERSSAKKRRRSRSANRQLSMSDSDSSIILIDDEDDVKLRDSSPDFGLKLHADSRGGFNVKTQDVNGADFNLKCRDDSRADFDLKFRDDTRAEFDLKTKDDSAAESSRSNRSKTPERKQEEIDEPGDLQLSPWGRTNDDAFFANLPTDEELLNLPPTSPIGAKTYNSPVAPLPSVPSYQSIPHKSPVKKAPVKRRPRGGKAAAGEKRLKTVRGRGKVAPQEDDDMDSDSECANPGREYRSPRISASQGTGGGSQATASVANNNNNNQSPMLNYSLIDTPILKRELKRYGLKPLPRSKAKILLRHIYKETHK